MKLLAALTDETVLGARQEMAKDFEFREASRAVVLNDHGEMALINVTHDGFYKLPGGGIEKGESHKEALRRECREEIGYYVEVLNEVGQVDEFRGFRNQKQVSYCYVARVVGEPAPVELNEKEIRLGQQLEWVPIAEAIKAMESGRPETPIGKFIKARDLIMLREALSALSI